MSQVYHKPPHAGEKTNTLPPPSIRPTLVSYPQISLFDVSIPLATEAANKFAKDKAIETGVPTLMKFDGTKIAVIYFEKSRPTV